MPHDIEIDQSGRTDRLNEDTVVAFSDGIQSSILLTAAVKRVCYFKLRERKMSKKVAVVTLFAAGLVILLQGRGKEMETICIDMEYPGWEGEILQQLLRRLRWYARAKFTLGKSGRNLEHMIWLGARFAENAQQTKGLARRSC